MLHLCNFITEIGNSMNKSSLRSSSQIIRVCIFLCVILFSTACPPSLQAQGASTAVEDTTVAAQDAATADAATEASGGDPAMIAAGEKTFKNNCATCHKVKEKHIGPALANVYDRRSMDWIKSFVKNSQAMIADGDPDAVALWEEYQPTVMTSFASLQDEHIEEVVAYIKAETEKVDVVPDTAAGGGGATGGDGGASSKYLNLIMVGLVIVLALILVVLFLIIGFMSRFLKDKENLAEEDQELLENKFNLAKIVKSPAFVGIVAVIFTIIVAKSVIDGLYTVGLQQGYAPKQPIAFSHQLHAGQYEIDCNYCHTGVRKGKSANIPSVNICQNCHNSTGIQNVGGQDGMSPEIQKIFAAVENNQPVEWVRVHNLPDLAYFNHSQHVEVGGLECQTCHGPIEEMEVVKQYSPLTMGWCIDCHKQTDVNTKGNAYYDDLVKLHEEYNKPSDKLKVEDIGGLECAKCHY